MDRELKGTRVAWSEENQFLAWVDNGVHIIIVKDAPKKISIDKMLNFVGRLNG